jgi:hypothetical protein
MNLSTPPSKVVAAVSGTPVPLAAIDKPVQKIKFSQDPASTAIVYIGAPTMVIATGFGVYRAFLPASANGVLDECEFWEDEDSIDEEQFAIASATVGQGCYVTYTTL